MVNINLVEVHFYCGITIRFGFNDIEGISHSDNLVDCLLLTLKPLGNFLLGHGHDVVGFHSLGTEEPETNPVICGETDNDKDKANTRTKNHYFLSV